jgi:transcription antitermination factor NusG
MSAVAAVNWYALRVRPRYEKLLSMTLQSKGFEDFLPLYRARRQWSDRQKELELPVFPGYLFCRFSLPDKYHIISAPGVMHIVGFGGQPVPVSEVELDAVRGLLKSGMPLLPYPWLSPGQQVYIERGPLKGVEGTLVAVKDHYRLVVSVSILQRSVSVELDSQWVRPSPSSARTYRQLAAAVRAARN